MTTSRFLTLALLALVAGCMSTDNSEAVGDLSVEIVTTGTNLDPNGYQLALSGQAARAVTDQDTTGYLALRIGNYTAHLSGIAANCVASPDSVQTYYQTLGIKHLTFGVACS
jgi:hypothetical protein